MNESPEQKLTITREIILDLLPLYRAGEASPASRALVEEYMTQDAEFARENPARWAESLDEPAPLAPPPELELKTLRRTHRILGWQRWLFGLGIGFTAMAFSFEFSIEQGRIREFHFLLGNSPLEFAACLAIGAGCWIVYFLIRRHLRPDAQ